MQPVDRKSKGCETTLAHSGEGRKAKRIGASQLSACMIHRRSKAFPCQEWPAEAVQDGQAGCKVLVSFVVGEFEVTYDILQMTPFAFAVLQYCSIAVEGEPSQTKVLDVTGPFSGAGLPGFFAAGAECELVSK